MLYGQLGGFKIIELYIAYIQVAQRLVKHYQGNVVLENIRKEILVFIDGGQDNAGNRPGKGCFKHFLFLLGASVGAAEKRRVAMLLTDILNTYKELRIKGVGECGNNHTDIFGDAVFHRAADGG